MQEDIAERTARKRAAQEAFGRAEQPAVPEVTFKLTRPGAKYFNMNEKVPMKVTFRGENVYEGVKRLIESGRVATPIPPHLAEIHSYGTNVIELNQNPDQ